MSAKYIFRRIGGRIIPLKVAAEVAGLSALAYPSAKAIAGGKMSERKKAGFELAGLGILGVATASSTFPAISKHFKVIRRLVRLKYGK